jgi:hypothetical protein
MNTSARFPTGWAESSFTGSSGCNEQRTRSVAYLLNLKTRKRKGNMGQENHLEAKSGENMFPTFIYESGLYFSARKLRKIHGNGASSDLALTGS